MTAAIVPALAPPDHSPCVRAKTTQQPRLYLTSILSVAVAVRVGIIWLILARYPAGWFFRSHGEVGFLAQSLLAGHGLSSPFGGSTGPTAFLAPGYPVFVAVVFHLLGTFTPASAAALMLLQTGCNALTILLMMRIADRSLGTLAANLAGAYWAIGIPFLFLPAIFWDTSVSILLLVAMLALALRCAGSPTQANWAGVGILAGVGLLINPAFCLTFAALYAWTIYESRRASSFRGPVLAALLALAIFAPWPIRNARVLHAFIPLRSNLGFELWKGNHPGSAALDDPIYYPAFNHAEFAAYSALGEVGYMRAKSSSAKAWIVANPARFLSLTAERVFRFWTGAGSREPTPILTLHALMTTLLGAFGLWQLLQNRSGGSQQRLAMLFLLPLLLFPLPYYLTHAETRFRLPIEPILTMLAAYAVSGRRVAKAR